MGRQLSSMDRGCGGPQQEGLSHHVPTLHKGAQTTLPVVFDWAGGLAGSALTATDLAVQCPVLMTFRFL